MGSETEKEKADGNWKRPTGTGKSQGTKMYCRGEEVCRFKSAESIASSASTVPYTEPYAYIIQAESTTSTITINTSHDIKMLHYPFAMPDAQPTKLGGGWGPLGRITVPDEESRARGPELWIMVAGSHLFSNFCYWFKVPAHSVAPIIAFRQVWWEGLFHGSSFLNLKSKIKHPDLNLERPAKMFRDLPRSSMTSHWWHRSWAFIQYNIFYRLAAKRTKNVTPYLS